MQKVYKYNIPIQDEVELELPSCSRILTVDKQSSLLCAWVLVNPNNVTKELHKLRIAGTGHPIENDENWRYINTIFMAGGALVFHIFEAEQCRNV